MKTLLVALSAAAVAAMLASCGGQPTTYTMQTPAGTSETVTAPKGTMTGAASVGDATALATMIQDSNNNVMVAYDRVKEDRDAMTVLNLGNR